MDILENYNKYSNTFVYLCKHYKKWVTVETSLFSAINRHSKIHHVKHVSDTFDDVTVDDKYIRLVINDKVYLLIATGFSQYDKNFSKSYDDLLTVISLDNPDSYRLSIIYFDDIIGSINNDNVVAPPSTITD